MNSSRPELPQLTPISANRNPNQPAAFPPISKVYSSYPVDYRTGPGSSMSEDYLHPHHWETYLNFILHHPEMICTSPGGGLVHHQWAQLTDMLNSLGRGLYSQAYWQRVFGEWQMNLWKKYCDSMKSTTPSGHHFNQYEKRFIYLAGWEKPKKDTTPVTLQVQKDTMSKIVISAKSPPPLIPLEGKTLQDLPSPPPEQSNNCRSNEEVLDDNEDRETERKMSIDDRTDEYQRTQREMMQILSSISTNIQGILGELKVISGALVQIAEK